MHHLDAISFGFSVGDFLAALDLVATVIDALRDSGNASSQNRELLRELYSLETALIRVKRLDVDDELQAEVIALRQAAGRDPWPGSAPTASLPDRRSREGESFPS